MSSLFRKRSSYRHHGLNILVAGRAFGTKTELALDHTAPQTLFGNVVCRFHTRVMDERPESRQNL